MYNIIIICLIYKERNLNTFYWCDNLRLISLLRYTSRANGVEKKTHLQKTHSDASLKRSFTRPLTVKGTPGYKIMTPSS